ncbi:MAG TPA: hypothetical protein VIP82_20905 [Microbacterium sp.]|uniref:hypothetical protein n=1 Tax=Microbacterium sp. TaxID=51671 RepID=UPI002F95132D
MSDLLTYRQAAALVKRSPRTIRYWRQQGMPMGWEERDGQLVRVVEQEVLQAWFRARLVAWPTHRWRMRKKLSELHASSEDQR